MAVSNRSSGGMFSDLFSDLLQDLRTLVSKEIEVAKIELSEKASASVRNSVNVAIGGAVAYLGAMALVAGAVFGLGTMIPLWLSALIVGSILAAAGGLFAIVALRKLKKMKMKPEITITNLREDKKWLKSQLRTESE